MDRVVSARTFAISLLALAACSFGRNPDLPKEREVVLTSFVEDMLLPRYQETLGGLDTLLASSMQYCEAPTPGRLRDVQQAWRIARAPWKQTEVFAFGPYKNEPLRLGPKIDSWPARPDSIEALIVAEENITAEILADSGVFLRGFPVIEYLIFLGSDNLEFADPKRCDYLLAATLDLQRTVGQLHDAWSADGGNYQAQFVTPDGTGDFDDSLEALSEMVDRLGFTAENLHAEKLTPALGAESVSGPDKTLMESRYSANSIDDISNTLLGIEVLFFGDPAQPGSLGLNYYLHFHGHDFDESLRGLLASAQVTLAAMPSLEFAIDSSPKDVSAAIEALKELQRFLQGEVTRGLDFTVGFNDTDGD